MIPIKHYLQQGLLYSMLGLVSVSCTKIDTVVPTGNESTKIEDIQISSSFNFTTHKEVAIELSTVDAAGNSTASVFVQIYHSKSNSPIFSGISNEKGIITANFNLLTQIKELVVIPRYKGFYIPTTIAATSGSSTIQSQISTNKIQKKSGLDCDISAGQFRTQTQGGWGARARGNNPGVYRDSNFATAFPNGLTVGSSYSLHLSSSSAVESFLPQGGPAKALTSNISNPSNRVSVLAGQIVALTLSVGFDDTDANFGGSDTALGDLIINSGTFDGWSVRELLIEANIVFGGGASDFTPSQVNDGLSSINENFVDGTMAGSFLTCPTEDEPEDNDSDGVPDLVDEYPEDPDKAFNNPVDGTLVWEDLWPSTGDFDFNDLVTDYTYNMVTNADSKVTEFQATFEVRAIGASYHNGLALQLDLAPDLVASVTGQHLNNSYAQIATNGTEVGQDKAVIFIFEDAFDVLPHPGSGHLFVNTYVNEPHFDSKNTNTITVKFTRPVTISELGTLPLNPFLVQNRARGYEIHLSDFANTELANASLFQTEKDDTQPAIGRYYRTATNLPWALHLPVNFDYPTEKTNIGLAYPKFKDWAESNGTLFTDWYEDKEGYRVNEYIYH